MSMPSITTIYRKTWSGIDVVCNQIMGTNRFWFNNCDLVYKMQVDSWAREVSESWEFIYRCNHEVIQTIKGHEEDEKGMPITHGYCIDPYSVPDLGCRFGHISIDDDSSTVLLTSVRIMITERLRKPCLVLMLMCITQTGERILNLRMNRIGDIVGQA